MIEETPILNGCKFALFRLCTSFYINLYQPKTLPNMSKKIALSFLNTRKSYLYLVAGQ